MLELEEDYFKLEPWSKWNKDVPSFQLFLRASIERFLWLRQAMLFIFKISSIHYTFTSI